MKRSNYFASMSLINGESFSRVNHSVNLRWTYHSSELTGPPIQRGDFIYSLSADNIPIPVLRAFICAQSIIVFRQQAAAARFAESPSCPHAEWEVRSTWAVAAHCLAMKRRRATDAKVAGPCSFCGMQHSAPSSELNRKQSVRFLPRTQCGATLHVDCGTTAVQVAE
jgi:hypothetical protein